MPISHSLVALALAACGVAWGQRHAGIPDLQAASPESQGLDSAVSAEALDFVRDKHIPLHSFLIVRNGMLVLEAYIWPYQGRELMTLHPSPRASRRRRSALRSTRGCSVESASEWCRSSRRRNPIRMVEEAD